MARFALAVLLLFAFPALALEAAPPDAGGGLDMGLLVPALVALGAALLRAALIIVRPNAAKLGKAGAVILLLLSVSAGFFEVLAGGGGLAEAIAVALSLLGGGVVGGAASKLPIVQERAARIEGGSIKLGR